MIQKKYMLGFMLGSLGSGLFISNMHAMRGAWQSSQSSNVSVTVGDSDFNVLDIDDQKEHVRSHQAQLTDENIGKIRNRVVKSLALSLKSQQEQQQMTQSPANLYKQYKESFQSNWDEFSREYKGLLEEMQISSLEDLKNRAGIQSQSGGEEGNGNQGKNSDLGSDGKGSGKEEKKEEIISSSDSSSSVEATSEDKKAALAALLQLSDHLTLSSSIKNQDDWRNFCNAFADLVGSGKWKQDQAYEWNGSELK